MEDQKKKVRVYALSTCPACKKVRRFLDSHDIIYECIEVDMLDSGEQWLASKELKKYNPLATFPTVVIEEVINGPDVEKLAAALGVA
ncbi:MAG: glutaredoxin family protein [Nitrospirae bacterium]|nr:glutaredoxin family protein [Nitrospirota bacterium]